LLDRPPEILANSQVFLKTRVHTNFLFQKNAAKLEVEKNVSRMYCSHCRHLLYPTRTGTVPVGTSTSSLLVYYQRKINDDDGNIKVEIKISFYGGKIWLTQLNKLKSKIPKCIQN
jgi:hypothetical protein